MSNTAQRRKEQRKRVHNRSNIRKRADGRGYVRVVCAGSGATIPPGTRRIVKYGEVSYGILHGEDSWIVNLVKQNPAYKHYLVVCPSCGELRPLVKGKRQIMHHKPPGGSISAGSVPQIMGWADGTTPDS